MDAPDILVLPQRAGYTVKRPQDLRGLPLADLEQVVEVARGLVQVEHEAEIDVWHVVIRVRGRRR